MHNFEEAIGGESGLALHKLHQKQQDAGHDHYNIERTESELSSEMAELNALQLRHQPMSCVPEDLTCEERRREQLVPRESA